MSSAVPDTEPAALLLRIAQARDREAFSELFLRFERQAYSLAYYLTRDRDLAEEAVQEGFLRIWLSAGSFRVEGKARSWMLRIVAGKSLEILRKRRRERTREDRAARQTQPTGDRAAEPEAGQERGELQSAVRRALDRMSEPEQQLLTLYFACELTQEEMAEQLDRPQRTISFQLQQALRTLRRQLAQEGIATEGGLPAPAILSSAILSLQPPAGLHLRILERLDGGRLPPEGTLGARAALGRWVARLGVAKGLGAATLLGLAAWAGQAYLLPAIRAIQETRLGETGQEPFYRRWRFERGPAPDLEAVQNSWSWQREADGQGAMHAPFGVIAGVRLPPLPPQGPFRLRITLRALQQGRLHDSAMWFERGKALPCEHWLVAFPVARELTSELYFLDQYIIETVAGEICRISRYPKAYPSRELVLLLSNVAVREIELSALEAGELKQQQLDPQRGIQELQARGATVYRHDGQAAGAPVPAAEPEAASPLTPPGSPFKRRWTFETGQANSLSFGQAHWQWKRLVTGEGAMVAPGEAPTSLLFREAFPKSPFRMTIDFLPQGGRIFDHALWITGNRTEPHECWRTRYHFSTPAQQRTEIYFLGEYVLQRSIGQTQFLFRYERPYPGEKILAVLGGMAVTALGFEELSPEQVRQLDFNPEREIEGLKRRNCEYSRLPAFGLPSTGNYFAAMNCKYYPGEEQPLGLVGRWSFERGIPADCKVLGQQLLWRKGGDGRGEAVPDSLEGRSILILPSLLDPRPYVLSIRLSLPELPLAEAGAPKRTWGLDPCWMDGAAIPPRRESSIPIPTQKGETIMRAILRDRLVILQTNGQTAAIFEYERRYPGRQVALALQNWALREIVLEAPSEPALKALEPDLESVLAAFRLNPRFGSYNLRGQLLRPAEQAGPARDRSQR